MRVASNTSFKIKKWCKFRLPCISYFTVRAFLRCYSSDKAVLTGYGVPGVRRRRSRPAGAVSSRMAAHARDLGVPVRLWGSFHNPNVFFDLDRTEIPSSKASLMRWGWLPKHRQVTNPRTSTRTRSARISTIIFSKFSLSG
jgi:hypothetical protein